MRKKKEKKELAEETFDKAKRLFIKSEKDAIGALFNAAARFLDINDFKSFQEVIWLLDMYKLSRDNLIIKHNLIIAKKDREFMRREYRVMIGGVIEGVIISFLYFYLLMR
ncbi:MAG: hypothetical protein ACTSU2_02420 [Promethearchaeota archaeon]